MMLRNVKYFIIVVACVAALLFASAAMLIQLVQKSEALTTELLEAVNQQSPYQLHVDSHPSISIFPWLGVQVQGVTLTSPSSKTPIAAQQVSIKFSPLAWMTGTARISAVRLSGLTVDADRVPPLLRMLEHITLPHITHGESIDIEIQQATVNPPVNHPWIQGPIENLHARIIGFNLQKPYTVNASGKVPILGSVNTVQVKTLAHIDQKSAAFRNTHLKMVRPTPHGQLRLVVDSNIDYTFKSQYLRLQDLIGFLNNAEFIGKLNIDLAKKQTSGSLHFLMFSLKNFAHAMDKSIKISDKSGAYNTKAKIHFDQSTTHITADIDKQPLHVTAYMNNAQKSVSAHAKSIKLTHEDIDLFSAMHSSGLLPSFNSHIEVDELFWNKLKLQNGMISIVQQHHNTDVTAKFKSFYQGTLTSALHVYNDHAAMQTVVKNSQLSPMLIDLGIAPEPTSGSINLVSESNSDGRTYSELVNHAHSRILVKLHNGYLSSRVDPATIIMQYLSTSNIQTTRPTPYQDIEAHCTMTATNLHCNPIQINTRNSKMKGHMDLTRPTFSVQATMWLDTIKSTTTIPLSVNYRGTLQNIFTEIDINNRQQSLVTKTHHILQHYA